MIGVDTNVLVRYLTQDVESLAARANSFFADRSTADPAFVSLAAVIETHWVLRRSYKFDLPAISRVFRSLLGADEVVFQAPDVVRRALRDAEEAKVDFADAVIANLGIDSGCDYTVTLDRRASGLPGMRVLGA